MVISFVETHSVLSYTPTPIQEIKSPLFENANVNFFVKREDLNHPFVSGNKWWKLKYALQQAKACGATTLLTFGGTYSNHIYATAAAARELGLNSIGIIRGEESTTPNRTLQFAKEQGMQLHFVSRDEYRKKTEGAFVDRLKKQFGNFYLIPEGGTSTVAIEGVKEFAQQLTKEIDVEYVCCACGTGGTLAGIIKGFPEKKVIGFSSLKGDFLSEEVRRLLTEEVVGEKVKRLESGTELVKNWEVISEYHFGGYAKYTSELLTFIENFEEKFSIPLEHVYTGKLFYGLFDLVARHYFPKGSKILVIHTGGLQGKLEIT